MIPEFFQEMCGKMVKKDYVFHLGDRVYEIEI
jgi:hypothetical protein